jgi:hypothetical protein
MVLEAVKSKRDGGYLFLHHMGKAFPSTKSGGVSPLKVPPCNPIALGLFPTCQMKSGEDREMRFRTLHGATMGRDTVSRHEL